MRRQFTRMLPMLGDDRLVLFLRPELAEDPYYKNIAEDQRVETIVETPDRHYGDSYVDWNLKLLDRAKLDVVFFPLQSFFPRPLPIPVVLHVADIQYVFFPEYFSPDELARRRERIPESVAMADAVITLSQFSKATMVEKLNADEQKLHVIGAAGFLPEEIAEADRSSAAAEALPHPFVLYPAADWPHKNHETLFKAMALLVERGRAEHLVLTGILSPRRDALRRLVTNLGLTDRVHFLGFVSVPRLIHLYRAARVMAFPSRFEGFGIPLVEAMQSGCPIVASKAEGVAETVGDAARFSEDSPESWHEALAEGLDDSGLRAELQRRGWQRAGAFDWDHCARRTVKLLRAVAGS